MCLTTGFYDSVFKVNFDNSQNFISSLISYPTVIDVATYPIIAHHNIIVSQETKWIQGSHVLQTAVGQTAVMV